MAGCTGSGALLSHYQAKHEPADTSNFQLISHYSSISCPCTLAILCLLSTTKRDSCRQRQFEYTTCTTVWSSTNRFAPTVPHRPPAKMPPSKAASSTGKKKQPLTLAELSSYDDVLTDALVDRVCASPDVAIGSAHWSLTCAGILLDHYSQKPTLLPRVPGRQGGRNHKNRPKPLNRRPRPRSRRTEAASDRRHPPLLQCP